MTKAVNPDKPREGAAVPGQTPLQWSDTQFRILVDGVGDYAIYMIDPDGIVATWNVGAERIKGYTPAEIVGRHYREFYTRPDRDAGEPERNLERAATTGRVESEGWRVRKDGSQFWAHVVIDRILDDDGVLIGFAKVTRDVTEQRMAAQQLEETREALFQSQKMEAIGQLTGGMAHDFNNLLMAIQSALDLLQRRLPMDERSRSIMSTALAGVDRGKGLTQRMLAFARRQELKPQAVDLAALVNGMADLLDRTLGSRFQLVTRFPSRLERALVDPHQLELALLNLVVNARDAYGDAGGRIAIEAAMVQAPSPEVAGLATGNYVRLSVIDEGQGMDATTLARATDPFFTTKGVGKGTGLGLSMVHGLAAQSRGRLALASEPGKGTRASVWLPLAGADHVAPEADAATEASSCLQPLPAMRILAVDDDRLVLVTLRALLEDLGHTVTAVSNGREAVERLRSGQPFDLLLTDYAMPGVTGAAVAQAAQEARPGMPMVLATGYAEASLGAFPDMLRLDKPFDRDGLDHVLRQAMAGRCPHG